MQYPESKMPVAVADDDGTVKIYGHENNGFRPFESKLNVGSKPAAIQYANDFNDRGRVSLGLKAK